MSGVDHTIAALASNPGGGVGVIRLSGPEAIAIARRHFRILPDPPPPRRLVHGWWHDGAGRDLDEGLCVVMPGPASYTGEDVVELHLHGGALNLRRALEVCWAAGARPAEPGEFTRRAFLNGRMDLTRAEAVADLVAARTDRALGEARRHLAGHLHEVITAARTEILALRARLEVNIDFVDEDVPVVDPAGLAADARAAAARLGALAKTWRHAHLWQTGARVVLTGAVNAGKSSLFNALVGTERAIVTAVPGTTRDTIEQTVDMLGVPVVLVDTAGTRDTADPVEQAGIDRTRRELAAADLRLRVVDGTAGAPAEPVEAGELRVRSKSDLPGFDAGPGELAVSALDGTGLDELQQAIVEALGGDAGELGPDALTLTRERHRVAVEAAATALEVAARGLDEGQPPELVAVDVQDAADALAELIGLTTSKDVLDHLFGAFCIGK